MFQFAVLETREELNRDSFDFEKVSNPPSCSFSLHHISIRRCPNHCHGKGCVIQIDQWIFPTEYFNELLILFPFPLSIDHSSIWPNLPKKPKGGLVIVGGGEDWLTSPRLGLWRKLITFSSKITPPPHRRPPNFGPIHHSPAAVRVGQNTAQNTVVRAGVRLAKIQSMDSACRHITPLAAKSPQTQSVVNTEIQLWCTWCEKSWYVSAAGLIGAMKCWWKGVSAAKAKCTCQYLKVHQHQVDTVVPPRSNL